MEKQFNSYIIFEPSPNDDSDVMKERWNLIGMIAVGLAILLVILEVPWADKILFFMVGDFFDA